MRRLLTFALVGWVAAAVGDQIYVWAFHPDNAVSFLVGVVLGAKGVWSGLILAAVTDNA